MSVATSITSTALDAERRSHEPSMEEILASIRRIIADDEVLPVLRRERDQRRRASESPHSIEAPLEAKAAADSDDAQHRAPHMAFPDHRASTHAPDAPRVLRAVSALEPQGYWLRPAHSPAPDLPPVDAAAVAPQEWPGEDRAGEAESDEAYGAELGEAYGQEAQDADLAETGADDPAPPGDATDEAGEPGPLLVSPDAAASVASHFHALAATMVINEADVIARYAQDMLRPMLKEWLDDNLPLLVERLVRAEIERVARGRR